MRSHSSLAKVACGAFGFCRPRLLAALAITAGLWASAAGAAGPAATAAQPPTYSEIATAVQKLKDDPNLATERQVHRLHWVSKDSAQPERTPWWQWISDLAASIAEAGRIFVWVACGIVAAVLAIVILRLVRQRVARSARIDPLAPTHVRDLDIRPESLPDDVGAAAWDLWSRGEQRASVALLYRGTLSRMAHAHGIPILHSTTEGESVALAARYLRADSTAYVADLVRVWQHLVYRGDAPQADVVAQLCRNFSAALDPAPTAAPPVAAGATA